MRTRGYPDVNTRDAVTSSTLPPDRIPMHYGAYRVDSAVISVLPGCLSMNDRMKREKTSERKKGEKKL
jgi:hypothetical protein